MKTLQLALLAGALTVVGSAAFAQTMAPNVGANLNDAYGNAEAQSGTSAYANAPRHHVRASAHVRLRKPATEHGTDSDAGAK
jgi:hypothetical protein